MKKRTLPLIFSTFSLAHPLQAADPVKEAVMAVNSDPALRDAVASVITRPTRLTALELARQNSTESNAPNSPSDKAENSSPTEASANPTANSLTKKNPTTRGKPFTVTYATNSQAKKQAEEDKRKKQALKEQEREKRAQEKLAQIIPPFFSLASSTQENIPQQGTKSKIPPSGMRQLFFTPEDQD